MAFILAFTFGIVADRYDARRALVREQAAVIRTAYLRSDFLPEPSRSNLRTSTAHTSTPSSESAFPGIWTPFPPTSKS